MTSAPPDGPYIFGPEVDLVELPVRILDDFPHFDYIRHDNRPSPGLSAASKVEEIWRDEFDYMYREVDGIPTITMHPQVIGRGHRMLMLERLIEHFQRHEGSGSLRSPTWQKVSRHSCAGRVMTAKAAHNTGPLNDQVAIVPGAAPGARAGSRRDWPRTGRAWSWRHQRRHPRRRGRDRSGSDRPCV